MDGGEKKENCAKHTINAHTFFENRAESHFQNH
jgi:hypothetical protein